MTNQEELVEAFRKKWPLETLNSPYGPFVSNTVKHFDNLIKVMEVAPQNLKINLRDIDYFEDVFELRLSFNDGITIEDRKELLQKCTILRELIIKRDSND
jgi:hypothetical protein